MIAAVCKYSKEPAKSHMMQSLIEKCTKAELEISDYVLFSKNGFIPELEQEQGLTLLTAIHMNTLLNDLSEDDALVYTNRKY